MGPVSASGAFLSLEARCAMTLLCATFPYKFFSWHLIPITLCFRAALVVCLRQEHRTPNLSHPSHLKEKSHCQIQSISFSSARCPLSIRNSNTRHLCCAISTPPSHHSFFLQPLITHNRQHRPKPLLTTSPYHSAQQQSTPHHDIHHPRPSHRKANRPHGRRQQGLLLRR